MDGRVSTILKCLALIFAIVLCLAGTGVSGFYVFQGHGDMFTRGQVALFASVKSARSVDFLTCAIQIEYSVGDVQIRSTIQRPCPALSPNATSRIAICYNSMHPERFQSIAPGAPCPTSLRAAQIEMYTGISCLVISLVLVVVLADLLQSCLCNHSILRELFTIVWWWSEKDNPYRRWLENRIRPRTHRQVETASV